MMCGNTTKSVFLKVPASELRLDDDFMKYQPKTDKEWEFKKLVEKAIKGGLKDFWHPVCDPSFDDYGRICYQRGKMPAVDKSYNWWEKNAKKFYPERGSRLGTKFEYIAFLAILINELVATGKSVEMAWNAVCVNSKELGHYLNSQNAKGDFEPTGSREIYGWCDLANCDKILSEDEEDGGFWLACGAYNCNSNNYPLANLCYRNYRDYAYYGSCGWLVLTEGSTDH